jgi:thiamine biosynthesis lipoprotein
MKQTGKLLGTPVTVEIIGGNARVFSLVFDHFSKIDDRFDISNKKSEIAQINNGTIQPEAYSKDMKIVLQLCEDTRQETHGYFNIGQKGKLDPSGLVKGLAMYEVAQLIEKAGYPNYCIQAGAELEMHGTDAAGKQWMAGIRNPNKPAEIVRNVSVSSGGIATAGVGLGKLPIYNPHKPDKTLTELKSMTVIATNVYDADRFATAAFAMGKRGLQLIEALPGIEAYIIDSKGVAIWTTGFTSFMK